MAARSKFTPETQERILKAIEIGATYALAAAAGGVSYETFNEWMKHKAQFSEAVRAAEGRAAMHWLEQIESAACSGNWQAAAWRLERRYPESYGRRDMTKHEHSGAGGKPIPIQFFDAGAAIASLTGGPEEDR